MNSRLLPAHPLNELERARVYLERGRNPRDAALTYLFFLVLFYCWTKRVFVSILLSVLLHFAGIVVWMIVG
jgi:hypothetical protein